jgi:hypothetical protein
MGAALAFELTTLPPAMRLTSSRSLSSSAGSVDLDARSRMPGRVSMVAASPVDRTLTASSAMMPTRARACSSCSAQGIGEQCRFPPPRGSRAYQRPRLKKTLPVMSCRAIFVVLMS